MKVFYTDKIQSYGVSLFLDSVTDLEYAVKNDRYVWESKNAGEILVKTLGIYTEVEFIKREGY